MTLGLVMAVVMNGVAYFFSDKIALMSSGAQLWQSGSAVAKTLRDSSTGAECICNGPQSEARVGCSHRGPDGIDDR